MVDVMQGRICKTEALKFVQEMPIDPNPVIWRSPINACRAHGELKLGEKINRQLIRKLTDNISEETILPCSYHRTM